MARSKYGNKRTERYGMRFDSMAEANVYMALKAREDAGEISHLRCQPNYELQPAFTDADGKKHRAITYTPDFEYLDRMTCPYRLTAVEVKGGKATQTQASRLRMKLFRFKYRDIRFELVEVK